VRATVKDGTGQAVAGAGVEVVGADGKPYAQRISMDSVADLHGGSATGADGVWLKKDLPAGPWKVRAALPDGRSAEESVTLVEGETVQVALTLR
jgi:protocatechuate 3,4-dioxygenase beta subunit